MSALLSLTLQPPLQAGSFPQILFGASRCEAPGASLDFPHNQVHDRQSRLPPQLWVTVNAMTLEECYRHLELPLGASRGEVRTAYKRLVVVWHPDRFQRSRDIAQFAEAKLKRINEAFSVLEEIERQKQAEREATARAKREAAAREQDRLREEEIRRRRELEQQRCEEARKRENERHAAEELRWREEARKRTAAEIASQKPQPAKKRAIVLVLYITTLTLLLGWQFTRFSPRQAHEITEELKAGPNHAQSASSSRVPATTVLPDPNLVQAPGVAPAAWVIPDRLTAAFNRSQADAARKAWAMYRHIDEKEKDSIGIEVIVIPPGTFLMGNPETMDEILKAFPAADRGPLRGEWPAHLVTIEQPFYLGVYEVTVGQFKRFVGETGYQTDAERDGKGGTGYTGDTARPFQRRAIFTWRDWGANQTDDMPVVNVSYNDALAFCGWLSRTNGRRYRLPTEAEWEYACRAGTVSRYYNGDDPENLVKIGNVADATARAKWPGLMSLDSSDGWAFTSPVGGFQPNGFSLYDMTGNAWEWCSDWFNEDFYAVSPAMNPVGTASGSERVVRGGGWRDQPPKGYCRSSARNKLSPDGRTNNVGFRVAVDIAN
jgi:sulfatase modifying factor 1